MNPHFKVFLSYAKEDIATARKLYEILKKDDHFKVWFDEASLIPGQNWNKEITKSIKKSDFFIALISKHSVSKRGMVQKELKEAIEVMLQLPQEKIYLIPVRLDNVMPSHDFLADIHWIDIFEDWNKGINKIKQAMYLELTEDEAWTKEFQEVDLGEILDEVMPFMETADNYKRELIYEKIATNSIVFGEKKMLSLALSNLIINGIMHSFKKTKALPADVIVTLYEIGSRVFVQIQNVGKPIIADNIFSGKIYNPFWTTSTSGTGLGLSVTQSIIEKHGGAIFVVSVPISDCSPERTKQNPWLTTFAIALPRISSKR